MPNPPHSSLKKGGSDSRHTEEQHLQSAECWLKTQAVCKTFQPNEDTFTANVVIGKRKYPVKISKELSCKKSNYIEINNQLDCFGSKEPHNDVNSCNACKTSRKVAFTEPSEGMSGAKVEQTSAETLSFRCVCERCRLTRGEVGSKRRKVAFTLAEVLITLGIIGVVAALTLPTLIQHHRKTVIETSLKKFYTTINQAVEFSVIDNGETSSWKFADTDAEVGIFYNTYFKKYLKDVKTKDAKTYYYVYFSDGSGVWVGYKGHDWRYCLKAADLGKSSVTNGSKCFKFGFYPTWGNGKGLNHLVSNYYNKGVEPYVGASKVDENGNVVGTSPDDIYELGWYAKAIQLNNWRIPDDYPVRY